MSSFIQPPGPDNPCGADVSNVPTPNQKDLGKSHAQGWITSGIAGHFWATLFSSLAEGLKIIITALVGAFDELLSLFVGFVTAAQGTGTQGFFDLEAQILNDFIGVEVAGADLAAAAKRRGLIGGMEQAGHDFLNVLLNIFTGQQISAAGGPTGLPGTPGNPITPEQGLKGMGAFLGFILSFALREGNLETISTAIPESFRMFEGIRSYGRIMAAGLGFGRLAPRLMRPILQEMVIGPMQRALNRQYRPSRLDIKQIATAFLRGDIDASDYKDRLAELGFADSDIEILKQDTYTRLSLQDVYLMFSTGAIDETDAKTRIGLLGYAPDDFMALMEARDIAAVQIADRAYAVLIANDLVNGTMTQADYEEAFTFLRIPALEKDALTRNAVHRKTTHHKHLSVQFLKKAYLQGSIDLNEFLSHAQALGYDQADVDILEQELLVEQKAAADKIKTAAGKAAAKATAAAAKAAAKKPPPATPAA
jgi:hypothetical protein